MPLFKTANKPLSLRHYRCNPKVHQIHLARMQLWDPTSPDLMQNDGYPPTEQRSKTEIFSTEHRNTKRSLYREHRNTKKNLYTGHRNTSWDLEKKSVWAGRRRTNPTVTDVGGRKGRKNQAHFSLHGHKIEPQFYACFVLSSCSRATEQRILWRHQEMGRRRNARN